MAADSSFIIGIKTKGAKKSEKEIKGVNASLKSMAKAAGVAAAAYFGSQALLSAISSSITLFGQQEEAEKKLRFAAGSMTTALQDQASALQEVTRFGDEQIIAQQAYLASLGLTQTQIEDTISASVDLAAATGMTLESAVMNTSKTLSGMAGELGEKLGPAFRDLTPEALKAGDGIKFIAEQFGGTASADANTFTGSIDQMRNAVGDAQEALGGVLAPVVQGLAGVFKSAAESASDMFLSITETDLESVIRRLKDAGVSAEALESLEIINLKNQLNDINEIIDEQGIKYKTVAEAEKDLTTISKDVETVGEGINSGIAKREMLLGRLNGLLDAQENGVLNQAGNYEVLNEVTGNSKEIAEGNLQAMIATTQATLGYAQTTVGLQAELDGVTLRTEQITDNAERQLDSSVKQSENIAGELELLTQKEEIEARIAELQGDPEENLEIQSAFNQELEAYIAKQEANSEALQKQIDLEDAYILKMRERGMMLDVLTSAEKKQESQRHKGIKTTGNVIASLAALSKSDKATAITGAVAATYEAANTEYLKYQKKYAAPTGTILGILAATAAVGRGISNVNEIKKARYGADFITSGPELLMVGEGAGEERVQVTPLVDPNIDGPQGQPINVNISGNVMHESFVEDSIIPSIREGLRLGENMGI
jgi:hypothetical protein